MGGVEVFVIFVNVKIIGEWFLKFECFVVVGWVGVGFFIGVMFVLLIIYFVYVLFGWQGVFMFIGVFVIFWVFFWWVCYNILEEYLNLSKNEFNFIRQDNEVFLVKMFFLIVLKIVSKNKCFYGIVIFVFMVELVWVVMSFWVLLYFVKVYGMDFK